MQYSYRLIIVRRDRPDVLRMILESRRQWPEGTAVMVDRRRADRRVSVRQVLVERRTSQRRSASDSLWHTQGFGVRTVAALPQQSAILNPQHAQPPDLPTTRRGNLVARALRRLL